MTVPRRPRRAPASPRRVRNRPIDRCRSGGRPPMLRAERGRGAGDADLGGTTGGPRVAAHGLRSHGGGRRRRREGWPCSRGREAPEPLAHHAVELGLHDRHGLAGAGALADAAPPQPGEPAEPPAGADGLGARQPRRDGHRRDGLLHRRPGPPLPAAGRPVRVVRDARPGDGHDARRPQVPDGAPERVPAPEPELRPRGHGAVLPRADPPAHREGELHRGRRAGAGPGVHRLALRLEHGEDRLQRLVLGSGLEDDLRRQPRRGKAAGRTGRGLRPSVVRLPRPPPPLPRARGQRAHRRPAQGVGPEVGQDRRRRSRPRSRRRSSSWRRPPGSWRSTCAPSP
jgi:hypothetical protein